MKIRFFVMTLVTMISLLLSAGCMESGSSSDPAATPPDTGSKADENGMVLIKSGTFTMGTDSDSRLGREMPAHPVTIGYDYKIFEREVTVAEYKKCVAAGACKAVERNSNCTTGDTESEFNTFGTYVQGQEQHPVNYISWENAVDFVKWLNSADVTGDNYRLCSSAEWEYAARAGTDGDYYVGKFTGMDEYAWIPDKTGGVFHEVKDTKKPNAWGLYNMYSNVNEYVQDTLHDNYNGAPGDGSAWETGTDSRRLVRGSHSRGGSKYYVRSTYSWYREPNACGYSSGIRYCQDIINKPPTVLSVTPAKGSTAVDAATSIVVSFNESVNTATVTVDDVASGTASNCLGNIQLKKSGESNCVLMEGNAVANADNSVFTLKPAAQLDYSATYVLSISGEVADPDGLKLGTDVTSDFSTEPIIDYKPSKGSTALINTNIVLTFGETVDPATVTAVTSADTPADACTHSVQLQKQGTATCVAMTGAPDATSDNTVFTLTPAAPLEDNVTYEIIVTTAVEKAAGGALLAADQTSDFLAVPLPAITQGTGLVEIPAGSFIMGVDSTSDDPSADTDEMPSRSVSISSFYMHQHETTAAEYKACMDAAGGCTYTSTASARTVGVEGSENKPANYVYWSDAMNYINWLNSFADSSSYNFRLCSEAEWEYVAQDKRAEGFRFSCGDDTGACLDAYEWWGGNVPTNAVQPVEQKLPNSYGVYDLIGNAREWVQDEYFTSYDATSDYMSAAPVDGTAWEDSSPDTNKRVVRGGYTYTSSSVTDEVNLSRARLTARIGVSSTSSRASARGFRVCADQKAQ